MHYISKSSRSDWKASRKDYLERKKAAMRRSAGRTHRTGELGGRRHQRRRPAAVRTKDAKQRLRRGLGQLHRRSVLTAAILLESVLWIAYGIVCGHGSAAGNAAVEAGAWMTGVFLAVFYVIWGSQPGTRRIRRRRMLLYLEYAMIALAVILTLWRWPEPVRGIALLPVLILGIDRISAFLG